MHNAAQSVGVEQRPSARENLLCSMRCKIQAQDYDEKQHGTQEWFGAMRYKIMMCAFWQNALKRASLYIIRCQHQSCDSPPELSRIASETYTHNSIVFAIVTLIFCVLIKIAT